jgi:hypothetical protein
VSLGRFNQLPSAKWLQQDGAVAQAFVGLAHMDQDFTAKASQPNRPRVPAIVARQEARPSPSPILLTPTFSRTHSR